jgi:hypothetical protein
MSILDKIGGFLGGGLGSRIADIIGSKMENKAQAELTVLEIQRAIGEREHEIAKMLLEQDALVISGQTEINKLDAASGSLFKGGWRPMVGWVCVSALAYQMVFRPLLGWASQIYLWMPPPSLEVDTLMTLLFALLGLGGFRTAEKIKGVA